MKAELGLVATELLSETPPQEQRHYLPRTPALPSPAPQGQAHGGAGGCAGCEHPGLSCPGSVPPRGAGLDSSREAPCCCTGKGRYTLSRQLKHTSKHTTSSLRKTTPLLFSTSVLPLIVCKKFQSALHFQYIRLPQGRSVLGREILTTSANASPLARFFLSVMIS